LRYNRFVGDAYAVARNSDHTLDEGLADIDRVTENDDVAALHLAVRKQVLAGESGGRESQFVHQHVIAAQECILHGDGGDHETLQQGGDQNTNRIVVVVHSAMLLRRGSVWTDWVAFRLHWRRAA